MALANLKDTDFTPDGALDPGHGAQPAPASPADIAISALEDALDAIARDDIERRCNAVSTASEAVTSLFLELDAVHHGALVQGVGRIYQTILARLVRINLRNDPAVARETIAMLEPLRDAPVRAATAPWRPARSANHRPHP